MAQSEAGKGWKRRRLDEKKVSKNWPWVDRCPVCGEVKCPKAKYKSMACKAVL